MKQLLRGVAASLALTTVIVAQGLPAMPSKGLTEVEGLRVGHFTLSERPTGCTVVLVDGEGAPGGVSQRGDWKIVIDRHGIVGVLGVGGQSSCISVRRS